VARVFLQPAEEKVSHREYVAAKVAAGRAGYVAGVRRSLPVLGGFFASFAGLGWDLGQAELSRRGARGESVVSLRLSRLLPDSWVMVPGACVTWGRKVAEVDVLAAGPPGVAVVEVKAWRGEFRVEGAAWYRCAGGSWEPCRSPALQVSRAAHLVAGLLRSLSLESAMVCPAVVLAGSCRVQGSGSPVPVYADVRDLVRDLGSLPAVLDSEGVRRVLRALGCCG